MSHLQNISRIKAVYNALEELAAEVVFVGGATVSLYADSPSGESRPTDDVDILIELLHYNGYAEVEEKLRQKGFENDFTSGVICRFIINGVMVDVMPTSEKVLGFSNRWYNDAFANAIEINIDKEYSIHIFTAVYFIAAKLEAYKSRGNNDGRTSSDFEDIVFILNYRHAIWNELEQAPQNVQQYLKDSFKTLLDDIYLYEWISAHLDYSEQQRVNFIIGGLNNFVNSL
jgi:predicted nucleotidyltransferase